MRALFSHLILPLPIFWGLLIVAILLYWKGKYKPARILFLTSLFWLLLVSTPFLPGAMVRNLERQYPVFSAETNTLLQKPVHILVLGAGHSNDNTLPPTIRLSEEALAKLTEAIRLHRQIPGSTIITSGFKGRGTDAQATVSAEAALLLGVDTASIKRQTEPGNTWQEATEYKRINGDYAELILITSAIHMPRAMFLFHKEKLNPVAAPAHFLVSTKSKRGFWFWMPASGNIKKMEAAIHEYMGIIWYKLGGA